MELRHLRYFVAVAEEQNFSRAAERIGIAQPALSIQIRDLEREVGSPLFERLPKGVALTEAGANFLNDARGILASVKQSVQRVRRIAAGETGHIRIGFTGSASFHPFVAGAIRDYRNAYPDIEVELIEEYTSNLIARLRDDAVDAAFIRPATGEAEDLRLWPLLREEMLAAMPVEHRLAHQSAVRLSDLRDEWFILYPRASGRALYDAIIAGCHAAGFEPRIGQQAPQMASIVNLIATGIGISIVPASMSQLLPQGVTYKRLIGGGPKADMYLACQSVRVTEAARRFTELVRRRSGLAAGAAREAGEGAPPSAVKGRRRT